LLKVRVHIGSGRGDFGRRGKGVGFFCKKRGGTRRREGHHLFRDGKRSCETNGPQEKRP